MDKINAFKDVCLVEKNIFSLYNQLAKFELQGNKDEYFKIISYLKMARELEDKLYDKDALYQYYLNNFVNDDIDLRKRISNRINVEMGRKMLLINFFHDDGNMTFFENVLKYDDGLLLGYFSLFQSQKLLKFVKKLQDEIDNCDDLVIKSRLISQKYRLIKLNPRLEKELLIYNFDIDKLIKFEDDFFECAMDYRKWLEYEKISDLIYSVNFFKNLVYRLFMFCDKKEYKINICYLSACLEIMSYGMLDEIKNNLNDILILFKNVVIKDDITTIVYAASDKVFSINSRMRKKRKNLK